MVISFVEDMKCDLDSLKTSVRAKSRWEILTKFTHLIEFHSNAQQLSNWFFFFIEIFQ